MIRLIIIITLLAIINSCTGIDPRPFGSPIHDFDKELKDASPDFAQGWRDGCMVGMAGGSNSFYQNFYKMNQVDGFKMAYSSDYKVAWGNAFWYCYRKDWTNQRSSLWGSIFNGYK